METNILPDNKDIAFMIRDDDLSYFTSPEQLKKVYGFAWRKGFNISFATIPKVKGIGDPNVPPKYRKSFNTYDIRKNEKLLTFLRPKLKKGQANILLHGYNHNNILSLSKKAKNHYWARLSEFYGVSKEEAEMKVKRGKNILEKAFDSNIQVFVPPHEYLSYETYEELKKHNLACCGVNRVFLKDHFIKQIKNTRINHMLFQKIIPLLKVGLRKLQGKNLQKEVFYCTEIPLLFTSCRFGIPHCLSKKIAKNTFQEFKRLFRYHKKYGYYFLLVTHYHSYFHDWQKKITQNRLKKYLDKVIGYVASQDNVWKCTVTEMVERIKKNWQKSFF